MITKGIILAGGTGSRLHPATKVTNKHLLPVYDRPMIFYAIETLKTAGITEILIICGTDHAGDFMKLLGSGLGLGVQLTFRIQDGAAGIADALALASNFAGTESIAMLLGDNIFLDDFADTVQDFKSGAQIFLKEVADPERFGVALLRSNRVLEIEEKPSKPKSALAVTGAYLFDNSVFSKINKIKPSKRGEFEITDVINLYLENQELTATVLQKPWIDAGTHDSLLEASKLIREHQSNRPKISKAKVANKKTNTPLVTVGIVAYKGRDYLPKTLEALLAQDYPQKEIIVLDNASPTADQELVKSNFPEVKTVKVTKNLGFSAAHNQIIRQMKGQYYFCLNQDVLLEPNYLTELVSELEAHKTAAAVTGKIKRWDFSTGYKTNFIDSVAIKATRSQRFSNEGQGEIDQGQYEESREIFACPSMAVLLRKTALEDIAYRRSDGVKEYFDELFFMYKEDIDLGYRLRWAGWANLYLPQAVAYHDRKAKDEHSGLWGVLRERKSRPKRLRQWAWINQQILLKKNFSPQFSFATRVKLKWFELTSSFWIRLLEKELSSSFKTIKELDKEIKSRQRQMKKTVKPEELEQFFA